MSDELTAKQRAARKRRLAEIFGDVLPEQTKDDLAEGGDTEASQEDWLRRQVPPHHG